MAKIVAQMLVRLGYGTVSASGGLEGLGRLAEESFDAVLSDVQMSGMGGFELLHEIHLRHPQLPVILMSTFAEEETRQIALAWGAVALLSKPFELEDLRAALRLALEDTSREQEGPPCPAPEPERPVRKRPTQKNFGRL